MRRVEKLASGWRVKSLFGREAVFVSSTRNGMDWTESDYDRWIGGRQSVLYRCGVVFTEAEIKSVHPVNDMLVWNNNFIG